MSINNLVNDLLNRHVLKSDLIIKAFEKVDRVNFLKGDIDLDPYGDYPISIGHGQTNSQPYTVAFMLEKLAPRKGQRILDIGSGSGWTTSLLSYVAGPNGLVIGLERVGELVRFGSQNIKKYNFGPCEIRKACETLGIPGEKFDRILVSASASKFPEELISQLNVGGVLVVPVENSILEVIKVDDNNYKTKSHYGFVFVPLIYKK